jgi:hypothetical protein
LEKNKCTSIPFYHHHGKALLCRGNHPFQHTSPSFLDPGYWYTGISTHVALDAVHTHSFPSATMSHAVVLHVLRNAHPTKPHPPWLQQLQAQWQATKQAFGGIRASDSGVASTSDSINDSDKSLKRKSSMQSLKEALHETKDALLTVIGLLSHKHRAELDDSWLNKFLVVLIEQACKHHTDN